MKKVFQRFLLFLFPLFKVNDRGADQKKKKCLNNQNGLAVLLGKRWRVGKKAIDYVAIATERTLAALRTNSLTI